MGKKTKSKARLDKYYHLSKEMGYRSRAAFKLIQLNKKYNFLSGATVLIDLCAAPGGWCQVASKEMPVSSIKIGIDLDPIKPIPGVTTFQCDITTEQCRHLIRKEIKHLKADVVLHDGAPNVGGQWSKDSYNQNELVLFSIKLAVEFLKEGGWFISKVFRSVDYNSLIYVMRQLFKKVEATKPLASRTQAAEIFVICQGYKNPSYIDPKLLDPKYALKQIDDEDAMKNNAINSIKAIFERKKNRSGYNTDTLFIVKTFKDFIECTNPFKFLFETHKIKIETEDCQKYINIVKQPPEYKLYFDDLQVLGKKEMEELVVWRNKIRTKLKLNRKENMKEEDEKEKENNNDKLDEKEKKEKEINDEMDAEITKLEKQKKKRLETQKKKLEKIELSNKRAFILQEDQPHDNDVEIDENLFDYIQKNDIDIENLEEPKGKKEEKEEDENLGKFDEVNLSDLSEDDYIDMMNEDIEQNKKLYEEEKELARKKKKEKKEKKKKKGEIEFVKNENDEDDLLLNEDLEDDDEEEENEGDDSDLYYEDDDENDEDDLKDQKKNDISLEENNDEDLKDDIIINNPLRREKKKKEDKKEDKKENKKEKKKEKKGKKLEDEEDEEEDNLSYDSDEKEEEKKENSLLNKKTNRSKEKDDLSSSSDSENDGYNSDDKAEIRAIAKKMLRKKERLKILNSSYNRYAFEDDGKVPKWFLDEEAQHNKPQKPITKAEVLAEKEYLKKITVRMPKKVLEAKARKRNRLNKRLQKIKKQAENIANQDEYTEISKVKQIEKLYKREINRSKEKKKYIISRSWKNNKGKDSRNIRHVDRRMKKDKRALKAREQRNKKYKRRR